MTRQEFESRIDTFFKNHIGKTYGYPDGQYVGECLSIVKLYMKEVFGFNPPASGNNSAYGYWSNFPAPLGDYFTKIPNTATGVPQRGDVPIWKSTLAGSNGYGHISIAIGEGDTNSFKSFDQNWGGKQAHVQTHDYKNIYGWLRPKNIDDAQTDPCLGVKGELSDALSKLTQKDSVIADLNTKLTDALNAAKCEAYKQQIENDSKTIQWHVDQLAKMETEKELALDLKKKADEKVLLDEEKIKELNKALNTCINQPNPTLSPGEQKLVDAFRVVKSWFINDDK